MSRKSVSFRVGKVQGYLRGEVWYLCYHEHGRRRRPRVGPDRQAARQLAAQVNAQLESGAPAALSFEPVAVPELRRRWLEHHEQVPGVSVTAVVEHGDPVAVLLEAAVHLLEGGVRSEHERAPAAPLQRLEQFLELAALRVQLR